jgi:hypothetical protein
MIRMHVNETALETGEVLDPFGISRTEPNRTEPTDVLGIDEDEDRYKITE